MNLWRKIEQKPQSWKNEAVARRKRRKKDWQNDGELRGIRAIEKRFVKK